MSLLNNIADVSFQTITLERRPREGNTDMVKAAVDLSFVQTVNNINNADQELEHYYIRVFGVNETDTARYFDYLCARQNEYLLAEKIRPLNIPVNEAGFVTYLQGALGISVPIDPNPAEENFSNRGKNSPYSMKLNAMLRPGQNNSNFAYSGQTPEDNVKNISPNTFIWESHLRDLLPHDSDGQIIRRPISSTTVERIQRPVDPNGESPRMTDGENIISNVDYGDAEEILTVQEAIATRARVQNLQRVFLPRIEFDITDQLAIDPGADIPQMTFYVFIYKYRDVNHQDPALAMTIANGMTPIRSANIIGQKTIWPPLGLLGTPPINLPAINPFDLNSYLEGSTVRTSPDAGFMQNISFSLLDQAAERFNSIYDKVYKSFDSSLLDESPLVRDSLGKHNHFTDLWFSKDSEENVRLAFGFDLVSYLAEHSYFPYLYRNEKIAAQLINGTGLMLNEKPSGCYGIKVRRRQYKTKGQIGNNQLGTIGRGLSEDPELAYPDVYLESVTPLDLYLPGIAGTGVPNQYKFFESQDTYRESDLQANKPSGTVDETVMGTFYYLCEGTVIDSSPALMRNVLRILSTIKHEIRVMFESIVGSVPANVVIPGRGLVSDGRQIYDPRTRRLAVPLSRITRRDGVVYRDHLLNLVRVLEMILVDFTPSTGFLANGLVDEVSSQLDLNGGLIDPEYFLELERVVDFSTGFFYKKLYEIFPTDPFGRQPANSRSTPIRSRGYQTKLPIYLFQHRFDTSHFQGSGYKSGQDFMMVTEPEQESAGLTRLYYDDYLQRCRDEFSKYFEPTGPQQLDVFAPGYADSSFRYFTPLIVRTPNQETINQPDQASGDGEFLAAPYDLNSYAKIFADKIELNLEGEYLNRENPQILDDTNLSSNENLYRSLKGTLWKHYATKIGQQIEPQYEAPRESVGPYPTTVLKSGASSFKWSGVLAIPALVGGESLVEGEGYTYIEQTNLSWGDSYGVQKGKEKPKPPPKVTERELPIKLPFAIFGEMSIDPSLDRLSPTYLKESFNSMTRAASILANPQNIAQVVQNFPYSQLPNQTKSLMTLVIASSEPTLLGFELSTFDAKRPLLLDRDTSEMEDLMISFVQERQNGFPLPKTLDPMKIYAKFMTFWMNYRNIFILEYLVDFGGLNKNLAQSEEAGQVGAEDSILTNKPKMPQWEPMSEQVFVSISKTAAKLLCRLRRLSPEDMITIFQGVQNEETQKVLEQYFNSNVGFKFPVYNKYFILEKRPDPAPQTNESDDPEFPGFPGVFYNPPPRRTDAPRLRDLPLLDVAIQAATPENIGPEDYAPKGETSITLGHLHHYNVDEQGNGWTMNSLPTEDGMIPHRHEIRNYVVQTALDHIHTLQPLDAPRPRGNDPLSGFDLRNAGRIVSSPVPLQNNISNLNLYDRRD